MRRLGLLLLLVLFPTALFAAEGAGFIPVKWMAAAPASDPLSPAWLGQAAFIVKTYPQASVPPAAALVGAKTLKVRAQYGAGILALHLEWPDKRPAASRGVNEFADAAAVQWPLQHGPDSGLPYIGMGHCGAPVALWFWRADGSVETLAAEGFGTLTAQPGDGVKAKGVWKNGGWRVVFARTLVAEGGQSVSLDPSKNGLMPVAFAVWNGEDAERNGLKRLSAWQVLRIEDGAADAAGPSSTAKLAGKVERGKRQMKEKGCAGCHNYPGNPARPRIGPDLTYAGGLHSAAYLAESLREPSKIVVPGKGYFTEQEGRRVSIMPPFEGSEAERNDILTYLLGLR